MTSATPDNAVGTTFKNVAVNENGEFVVQSASPSIPEVYRWTTAPASPVAGWLWVDTTSNAEVLKQWNWTSWSELDHLSVSGSFTTDFTLSDWFTLAMIDGNSWLPITATLPAAASNKWRRIEFYKRRWASPITLASAGWNFVNTNTWSSSTYGFKNILWNYFMSVRSDGSSWIVDDDNIYNRVANTLFVDLNFGNNTYAVREFESRPFATVAAAVTASLPWDTIVLRSGTYAIWNITTVHNLNFQAEAGVVVVSWSLTVNSNNTVTWTGWVYNWTAATNEFFSVWDWTIYFDFESITTAWRRFVRNIAQTTLSPKVYGRAKTLTNSALWVAADFAITLSAWLWAWLTTIIDPIIDVEFGNVIWLWILYITNSIQSPYININFDRISFEWGIWNEKIFHIDWAPILNLINNASFYINGNYIKSWSNNSSSNALFLINSNPIWNQSNSKWTINVWRYEWNVWLFLDNNCANSEVHINGDYHYSSNRSLYVMYQANWTGAPVTKSSTLYNHTKVSEVNWTWVAWWASTTTPWAVFIVAQWASYICDSLENKSLQYIVWWVDNQSVPWINDNYTQTYIKFYWTKLLANNQLVWSNWLLHNDEWHWSNAHPKITYEFYSWCSFELLWNAVQLISWAAGWVWTISEVNFYDDYTTNIWFSYWASINKISYLNNHTTTIAAWWTYTVLDSDKDLYYDLATLWNLTLVLPDPAKFVNREINFKVTSTHASNTVTIDPAWAALIDGSATYVVPNTSTWMTNIVTKSNWAWRRIK